MLQYLLLLKAIPEFQEPIRIRMQFLIHHSALPRHKPEPQSVCPGMDMTPVSVTVLA